MEKKQKTSLTWQLILTMVVIVAGTVAMCWFFNTTFLEKYYIFHKEKELKSSFDQVRLICEKQGDSSDDAYVKFEGWLLYTSTCVCSVGLDMIAIPGDTKATTISGMIADEMAIGMVNQKTTAARLIPAVGKGVGDRVEFGGLFGYAPVMPVNKYSCDDFINRTGRIPAPIHSFKN